MLILFLAKHDKYLANIRNMIKMNLRIETKLKGFREMSLLDMIDLNAILLHYLLQWSLLYCTKESVLILVHLFISSKKQTEHT